MAQKKQCYFCVHNTARVDWKDAELLKKFLSYQYKISPRKRTGLCAKHQRQVARAIKRARIASLIPFTPIQRHKYETKNT